MPHNIGEYDTMVSANGVVPWHRLGTIVPGDISYDDVLILAGLDWEVELMPAYAGVPREGEPHNPDDPYRFDRLLYTDDHQFVVRRNLADRTKDRIISVVGSGYEPVQNAHGLEFLRILMDAGDLQVETAGSLGNNRIIWICARMDRNVTIAGDETVPYLVFSSSHDRTMAAGVVAGPVRVVCNNTLTLAIERAIRQWRTRHVGDVRGRVAEAREALAMGARYYDTFETEVNLLLSQSVSDVRWTQVRDLIVPCDDSMTERMKRNRQERHDMLDMRWIRESDTMGRNAWAAVQAVNGYELWDRRVIGTTVDERTDRLAERQAMAVLRARQPLTEQAHRYLLDVR